MWEEERTLGYTCQRTLARTRQGVTAPRPVPHNVGEVPGGRKESAAGTPEGAVSGWWVSSSPRGERLLLHPPVLCRQIWKR